MRLSELVSSLGLSIFPIIGLIAFTVAFLMVLARVARTKKAEVTACAALPLADGTERDRSDTRPANAIHGGDA